MANFNIPFTSLQQDLIGPYANFMATTARSLCNGLGPVMLALSTIYIGVQCIKAVLGQSDKPLAEIVKTAAKVYLVSLLVLNYESYNYFIADPMVNAIPDGISQFVTGKPSVQSNQFDSAANALSNWTDRYWRSTSYNPFDMATALVWIIIVTLIGHAVLIAGFILTMFTKAVMSFVFGLGPVFVMLYLYDGTRSFFNHFVNTGVTLIIQQVLIAAVMALILQTVTTAAGDRNADPALQASTLIYLYLFVGYIMYEIPHLAQRLAGNGFGASWSSFGGSRSEATRNADLPELSDGTRGAGRNGVGMSGGGPSGSAPQAPRPGTRTETAHSVPGMAQSSPSRAGGLGHAGNFADQESPSQSVSTTGAAMDANAAGQDGFAAALQRGVASMAHPRPNEGNVLAGGQSTSSDGMGRGVGSGVGGVMGRGTGRSIQGGAGLDSGSQASASEPRLGASSDTGAGSAFGHSRAAGDGLGGVPASASEHTTRTETAQSEQRADVPVGRGATAVASRGVAIPDNQEPTDQFS